MKRSQKDYGWPHMFYCKADGTYLICKNLGEVPEGFVDTRGECDVKPTGVEEPQPYAGQRPASEDEEIVAEGGEDDESSDEDNGDEDAPKGQTLKQMGIKRKEAIAMLEEEGVDFNKKATNEVLAGLIEGLLEEETGE